MKKNLIRMLFLVIIVFGSTLKTEARSPSKIELSYDKETKMLHVVVKHVSSNMRKHYIRKLNMSRNDEASMSYYFPAQTSAAELITDIPLDTVVPNDVIHVEAVCSEAGRLEQTLVIPE